MSEDRMAISKIVAITIIVVVIVVVAAGLSYYYYVATGKPTPSYIKIGFVTPTSGAMAAFGEGDPWVVKQVENAVNSKGGIYIAEYGRRIPVKILIRDSQSNPNLAAQLAADLATKDKVSILVTLHTPVTANSASKQAERYKVPTIVSDDPVLSWLRGGPYNWVYNFFFTDPDLANAYVGYWDTYFKDKTNGIAAGLGTNDVDGKQINELVLGTAKERGYKVAGIYLVAPGTRDFSKIIQEMKDRHVELLHVNMIPPDFQAFWSQAHAMGFVPKSLVGGRFVLFYSQAKALGNLAIGITCSIWVYPTFPYRSSLTGEKLGDFLSRYEKETGKKWSQAMVDSYSAFEVTIDSLKRAGSLDKGRIRDAIAKTDLDTLFGKVCFSCPLTPKQEELYKKFSLLIENKDHYSPIKISLGQWRMVKGELVQVPVYTMVSGVPIKSAIPMPGSG